MRTKDSNILFYLILGGSAIITGSVIAELFQTLFTKQQAEYVGIGFGIGACFMIVVRFLFTEAIEVLE